MTLQTTTIRPGFLVSLKTSLTGNVTYAKRDLTVERDEAATAAIAKWETERTIAAPAEHEAGIKARTKARGFVTRICTASTFGLLCPEARQDELKQAITEARALADEFNATAQLSHLHVGVIVGRVAQDDVEATRAINEEVRSLLDEMATGIQKLDVKAVRDAADRARSLGQMLTPEAQAKVQKAIDAARDVAKRMVKAGEEAAQAIDQATMNAIATARTAFLDMDDQKPIQAPAVDQRALDLEVTPGAIKAAAPVAAAIEV